MIENKIRKFESPARIAELSPKNTLIRAGFKENMILCDIGAGSGIFSFPAAQISSNSIYTLEKSDSLIELLKSRVTETVYHNLIIRKVASETLPIDNNTCDMAIMVTVLHEIEDKLGILNEIKRILIDKGKLMIIEFHKRETPMGPPTGHRISEEETEEICHTNGFLTADKFSLGDNFFCIIFELP